MLKIRVTIRQMKLLMEGLEGIAEDLPNDARLNAVLAEAPLEHLLRMIEELDQYFAEFKQVAAASTS
jgi:hypothetical protein